MLSTKEIAIVKSTIPILEQGGTAITAHFYQRMFAHHPELQDIFNMSNQHNDRQRVALFEAVLAYAKNIDNLEVLEQAVERIAHKHSSFSIQPEHYQIVGHHLIESLKELVPEQFTSEVEQAWKKAYELLANVFIHREEEIYQSVETQSGGWRGTREFSVVSKETESELVTSFELAPVDGEAVAAFQPGQYLAVEMKPEGHDFVEIRQYSLSDKPHSGHYRISVKKEPGDPKGVISNYLHEHIEKGDTIQVHPPAGDFFFVDRQSPVVLISGGVGATPMQSMLEHLSEQDYPHPVYYLHACESKVQHSFALRTSELCESHRWENHTWYRQENNFLDSGYHTGLMNLSDLKLPHESADFYVCGPIVFMRHIKHALLALGVEESRIHYEVFGPHDNF